MQSLITGVHHVTAFAKHPKDNRDFYTRVLGLRMVKKTVNFDDPFTYHLYFGDHRGSPGTLLTHFPNPRAARARHGTHEITDAVLALPIGSLSAFRDRLRELGVKSDSQSLFGSPALAFEDPDGMRLLAVDDRPIPADSTSTHPSDAGRPVSLIDAVVIRVPDAAETERFLTEVLGFARTKTDHHAVELSLTPDRSEAGRRIILIQDRESAYQPMGAGTIHHVAWRVPDEQAQARAAEAIRSFGVGVTPIIDRQYFRSIYFRIPGGVVFEIATDTPGFDADEPLESLGEALKLPPQHEPLRSRLESTLVPLD